MSVYKGCKKISKFRISNKPFRKILTNTVEKPLSKVQKPRLLTRYKVSIYDPILNHFPKIPECVILFAALNLRFCLCMVYGTNI